MKKQKFTFSFPMSGETITKEFNLLAVKDATVKYLRKQSEVRGDICLVFDEKGEIVAMAHIDDNMKVKFFTEDDSLLDIKSIGDISSEINGQP
jgi:hypothetical protein